MSNVIQGLHAALARYYQDLGYYLAKDLPSHWQEAYLRVRILPDGGISQAIFCDNCQTEEWIEPDRLNPIVLAMLDHFTDAGQEAFSGLDFRLWKEGRFSCGFVYDEGDLAKAAQEPGAVALSAAQERQFNDILARIKNVILMAVDNSYFGGQVIYMNREGQVRIYAGVKQRSGAVASFFDRLNGNAQLAAALAQLQTLLPTMKWAQFPFQKSEVGFSFFVTDPPADYWQAGEEFQSARTVLSLPADADDFTRALHPSIQSLFGHAQPHLPTGWQKISFDVQHKDGTLKIRAFLCDAEGEVREWDEAQLAFADILKSFEDMIAAARAAKRPWTEMFLGISHDGRYSLSHNAPHDAQDDGPIALDPALRDKLKPIEQALMNLARPQLPDGWAEACVSVLFYDRTKGDVDVSYKLNPHDDFTLLDITAMLPILRKLVPEAKKIRSAFRWADAKPCDAADIVFTPDGQIRSRYRYLPDDDE